MKKNLHPNYHTIKVVMTDGNEFENVTVKRIAGGLAEPIGIAVHQDRIFVLQKQELTKCYL